LRILLTPFQSVFKNWRPQINQRQVYSWIGIALFLILFTSLLMGARRVSITTDEMGHVAFGYAVLARGTDAFWMSPLRGQPLLLNVMEAFLPYLANPDIPLEKLAGWEVYLRAFVEDFAFQMFRVERAQIGWARFDAPLNNYPMTLPPYGVEQDPIVARVPIVFLTVLLGALVFRWGRELWGAQAGLLALFLLTFDPLILANGRLACTDMGTSTLGTAALYLTWRWMERPAWRLALGAGALLGLTMMSKSSGVLWVATVALIVVGNILFRRKASQRRLCFTQGVAAGIVSLSFIWACYGFTVGRVEGLPFPLPAPAYWEEVRFMSPGAGGRWVFALGMRKYGNWWWYFPVAFLIKNPLPLLFSLVIGAAAILRRAPGIAVDRPLCRRAFTLLLFPLFYAAMAIGWGMNIGYRHLLPIHPFLYLLAGGGLSGLFARGSRWPHWLRYLTVGLLAWLVIEAGRAYPNEIAYFNQLVGGPEGGYRYLSDSNVEWGQSADALYAYAQTHPGTRVEPPASPFLPAPGRYIVNATQLQGMNIGDPFAYEWFRHREPAGILHETLLLYDVPPHRVTWFAQCTAPHMPLDDAAIARGTGLDELRKIRFDCTQTWLYPSGETGENGPESPVDDERPEGIYALNHDLIEESGLCLPTFLRCPPTPVDPFLTRRLFQGDPDTHLSYEREIGDHQSPTFVLYEVSSVPVRPLVSSSTYVAPVEAAPGGLASAAPASGTVLFDGRFAFLGAAAYQEEEGLDVETWWWVALDAGEPITRPISIMGHLLTTEGETLGVADGLGISPLYLRTGDVFVQRHRFSNAPAGSLAWLRVGVYWLDTMARWPVTGAPASDAVFVPLEEK